MADPTEKLLEKYRLYSGQRPDPTEADAPYFARQTAENSERQYLMLAEIHRQLVWNNRFLYVLCGMVLVALMSAITQGAVPVEWPWEQDWWPSGLWPKSQSN